MFYRIFVAAILVLGVAGGFDEMVVGQSLPNSETETFEVRGTVVNSVSGEPIPGALVRLDSAGQSAPREVRADAEGKFSFSNVPPKTAKVSARKPGYFAMERDPEHLVQFTVVVQKDSAAAIVRLVPEGVIYGRITGADGEPIEGMQVQALKKKIVDGKGRWVSGEASTVTDDEGRFRLAELHVGSYFLLAGPEHFNEIANGADSSKVSEYGAMFYPGVADFAEATAIELPAGRHTEADVKLARQELYRVSGIVEGAPEGALVHLVILNETGQGIGMYPSNPATGAFDATSVPTSASLLAGICEGSEGLYVGERKLRLTANLTGVKLMMMRAPDIAVKVRKGITHQETPGGRGADRHGVGKPAPVHLALVSEEADRPQGRYEAEPWGDEMVIRRIFPGSYRLEVDAIDGPWYLASAQIGDVDLLNEDLTVAPGSGMPPMEIMLRDDGANLAVRPQKDGAGVAGFILVWPQDAQMMIQAQQSYVGTPARFEKLRPGRYLVLALEAGEEAEYRNAEFRQKYESKWQEITLEANQSATIKVELTKDLE